MCSKSNFVNSFLIIGALFNISSSFSLDPYATDRQGFRVNKLDIDPTKFKFGHFTNGSISISTSFKSKDKKGKDKIIAYKSWGIAYDLIEKGLIKVNPENKSSWIKV